MKSNRRFYSIIMVSMLFIFGRPGFTGVEKIPPTTASDAFSGATPKALEKDVPDGLLLTVDGQVKQVYRFSSQSFRRFSRIRLRTREVSPTGEIMGAYIYTGIPAAHILEGIATKKESSAPFDRPLDLAVIFTTASGQSSCFSYGELLLSDDSLPITLAYDREPLQPSSDPGNYTRNKYRGNISGLRLLSPRETDTGRYLDNVVKITFTLPATPDHLLPRQKKGLACDATSVICLDGEKSWPATWDDLPQVKINQWFRIGHGKGIKEDSLVSASGIDLRAFLKKHFPGLKPTDFFLFVGCDGYRSLFSAREIFSTQAGESMALLSRLDEKPVAGGWTMGVMSDFFVDRCVRGITQVVKIGTDRLAPKK